ncbi:MAG: hypothetical protein Q9218_006383 [Villophora microphyllina]
MLATTDVSHMVEFNGFTTRMEVIADNGLQQKDVDVVLTATSPVSVFINDIYHVLSSDISVTMKSDAAGAMKIIQHFKALAKLYTINDKDNLNNAKVTHSDDTPGFKLETLCTGLLDCVAAVIWAAEWIFDKIKVLVEDLVAFVGFLFSWKDIVRTHMAIKNMLKQYGRKAVVGIGNAERAVAKGLDGLQTRLNVWAGIPDSNITFGSSAAQANSTNNGANSPQAHWNMQHDKIIADLESYEKDEYAVLKTAVDSLKSQFIDRILTLFLDVMCFVATIPVTIMYKIVAGAASFLDNSTTNALMTNKDFAISQTTVKSKNVTGTMHTAVTRVAVDPEDIYKKFTIIGQYLGMLPFVELGAKEAIPEWMIRIAVPTTLLALSPYIIGAFTNSDEWDVVITDIVISLQFMKTYVDASVCWAITINMLRFRLTSTRRSI